MKKYTHISQTQKGFTLIETLVAVFIVSMSITALLSVVGQNIFTAGYLKNKAIATGLAVEGVELVRNIQDSILLSSDYGESPISVVLGDLDGFALCSSFEGLCFIDPISLAIASCQNQECPKLLLSGEGYYNYYSGQETNFTRSIEIDFLDAQDSGTVTVRVEWLQGQTLREVSYQTDIFLWIR